MEAEGLESDKAVRRAPIHGGIERSRVPTVNCPSNERRHRFGRIVCLIVKQFEIDAVELVHI